MSNNINPNYSLWEDDFLKDIEQYRKKNKIVVKSSFLVNPTASVSKRMEETIPDIYMPTKIGIVTKDLDVAKSIFNKEKVSKLPEILIIPSNTIIKGHALSRGAVDAKIMINADGKAMIIGQLTDDHYNVKSNSTGGLDKNSLVGAWGPNLPMTTDKFQLGTNINLKSPPYPSFLYLGIHDSNMNKDSPPLEINLEFTIGQFENVRHNNRNKETTVEKKSESIIKTYFTNVFNGYTQRGGSSRILNRLILLDIDNNNGLFTTVSTNGIIDVYNINMARINRIRTNLDIISGIVRMHNNEIFLSKGNILYIYNINSGKISEKIFTYSEQIMDIIVYNNVIILLGVDGELLKAQSSYNLMNKINLITGKIPLESYGELIKISNNGKHILVSNSTEYKVYNFDSNNNGLLIPSRNKLHDSKPIIIELFNNGMPLIMYENGSIKLNGNNIKNSSSIKLIENIKVYNDKILYIGSKKAYYQDSYGTIPIKLYDKPVPESFGLISKGNISSIIYITINNRIHVQSTNSFMNYNNKFIDISLD